jgi:hypothetical protein
MSYQGFDYQNKTAQEVFDFVANHLLTQNKKSTDSFNNCVYRSQEKPDGTVFMCAAGCLLSDGQYMPQMEGHGWGTALIRIPPSHGLSSTHENLIVRLQLLHDGNNPSEWTSALKHLADQEDLTFSPPPQEEVHVPSQ